MGDDFHIGVDIVDVARIKKIINAKNGQAFLKKVFTSTEISYCMSKASPEIHFSGRFAAKEAIKKALLSSKLVKTVSFTEFEVVNEPDGAPVVKLSRTDIDGYVCKVSISHTENSAIGFAILSKVK